VLSQSYSPHELIVVDDGSTDDTATVVSAFKDSVRYLRMPNGGAAAARNAGLETASGDCVAFLDADDAWYPRKLELQVEVLARLPAVLGVCSDFGLVDELAEPLRDRFIKQKYRVFSAYKMDWPDIFPETLDLRASKGEADGAVRVFHGDALRALFLGNFVNTSSIVVRRVAIEEVGRFTVGRRTQEDYECWLKIARRGPLAFVDTPLLFFRRRPNQLTSDDQRLRIAQDIVDVIAEASERLRPQLGDRLVNRRLGERLVALALAQLGAERAGEARVTLRGALRVTGVQVWPMALFLWSYLPRSIEQGVHRVVRYVRAVVVTMQRRRAQP